MTTILEWIPRQLRKKLWKYCYDSFNEYKQLQTIRAFSCEILSSHFNNDPYQPSIPPIHMYENFLKLIDIFIWSDFSNMSNF